jgi:competence protein ComEA
VNARVDARERANARDRAAATDAYGDPVVARAKASRRSAGDRSLAPVDLDIASVAEVAALPLIGPALARRIVGDRIERGPFGSITGLERIPGVSAALARRLQPYVTFSRPSRPSSAGEAGGTPKKGRRP